MQHFKRSEFSCKCGCGFQTVDYELADVLDDVRDNFGPVTINCGCRCKEHNAKVGGEDKSKHMEGLAADIRVQGIDPSQVYDYLAMKYNDRYGIGKYSTFTHIDTRQNGPARWVR